ncbi:MAG: hypothetical protein U5L45_12250 [Saprospiraceae bacterium]|nr:hypothetical protein [Saprospiraceae bacterium]
MWFVFRLRRKTNHVFKHGYSRIRQNYLASSADFVTSNRVR